MAVALAEPDVLEMPDVPDDFELIDGKLVECRPMSFYAGLVANAINFQMVRNEACCKLGRSLIEQYFWFPTDNDPKRVRRPDLAFLPFETWPESTPIPLRGNTIAYLPDLAVEVISPGDNDAGDRAKRRDYLDAGVKSVWIVYPEEREIYCYSPGSRAPRVFGEGDILTDAVLPDFELRISGLFPPVQPAPKSA
jgi:Uma2 family endonuclease